MSCPFCQRSTETSHHAGACPAISPDPTIRMLADALARIHDAATDALNDLDALIHLLSDDDRDDPPGNPILN